MDGSGSPSTGTRVQFQQLSVDRSVGIAADPNRPQRNRTQVQKFVI